MNPRIANAVPTRALCCLALLGLAGGCLFVSQARAAGDMASGHEAHSSMMHMEMPSPPLQNTVAQYRVPDVTLIREDGTKVNLKDEIGDGKPVILNFIFTSCTTVCPVLSRTMSMVQSRLGAEADKVHLVSISIDPEQDTPARLATYAKRYHAGPSWHFYTGTLAASITTQKAFNAYRGDKMDHEPATYLRLAPGQPWLRMGGFATADNIVRVYHRMLAGESTVSASAE